MKQALAAPIDSLVDICVARLRDALDPATGMLSRRFDDGGWVPGGDALAGSAIGLIGLSRAGIPPREVLPDPAGLCRGLAAGLRAGGDPGGIGLLLWANGAIGAAAPLALLAEAGFTAGTLELLLPGLTTTEAAWLLSGLLHAGVPALRPVTIAALRELESRLNEETLVFRHAGPAAPLRHRLRRHLAGFPAQAFALQALAFAALVLGDPDRRRRADRCGTRLVATQGPLGQWWRLYDAASGRVAERYPLRSVHQHSLGPMALRALAQAGGRSHAEAAATSRAWLQANELGIDLVEPGAGLIWGGIACIERGTAWRLRQARLLLGLPAEEPPMPLLRLDRGSDAADWGWLLYAMAIEHGTPPPGHLV